MPETPSSMPVHRRELLEWFRTAAEPLAAPYEGAIRLLEDASFPGRLHFIAHAGRDICDRLVSVLDPQFEPNRVQYENEMDKIEKEWPVIHRLDVNPAQPAPSEETRIPHSLALRIDSLVEAHRSRRARPSNFELLFRCLMRNEPTQQHVNFRIVADFKKTREWFMEWAHARSRSTPPPDEIELQARFRTFEGILHSFVGSFFTTTKELDEILQATNH